MVAVGRGTTVFAGSGVFVGVSVPSGVAVILVGVGVIVPGVKWLVAVGMEVGVPVPDPGVCVTVPLLVAVRVIVKVDSGVTI